MSRPMHIELNSLVVTMAEGTFLENEGAVLLDTRMIRISAVLTDGGLTDVNVHIKLNEDELKHVHVSEEMLELIVEKAYSDIGQTPMSATVH